MAASVLSPPELRHCIAGGTPPTVAVLAVELVGAGAAFDDRLEGAEPAFGQGAAPAEVDGQGQGFVPVEPGGEVGGEQRAGVGTQTTCRMSSSSERAEHAALAAEFDCTALSPSPDTTEPPAFDLERYKRRNVAGCGINELNGFRAVATVPFGDPQDTP